MIGESSGVAHCRSPQECTPYIYVEAGNGVLEFVVGYRGDGLPAVALGFADAKVIKSHRAT